ncbi:hypothetical protein BU25DRAFT_240139 [Macroventuria anomochaeta]|uniref:Uncharacterized protein n=1 Tax=Macroventuria anomochaeta TaxID=301207 RepID=A0ACB6RHH8_9PLEO|nr:uncharacterized protein BU25DRAFT_240139 [Macroventuria anomochaeta]KAF2621303.1 hypothetical protein BU25DRAFT_240139 [Macroventuria anomochaeta]
MVEWTIYKTPVCLFVLTASFACFASWQSEQPIYARGQHHPLQLPTLRPEPFGMPPQTPASPSKPHRRSSCTRSFATRKALADHSLVTSHGFPCTALQGHRSSPAHTALVSTAPENAVNSGVNVASGPLQSGTLASQVVQEFKCTIAGCNKIFKTSQSRTQHLESATHGKKVTGATAKSSVEAATVKPKVHSRQNAVRHKKSVSAPKPAQPSLSKNIRASVHVPLFRWDTRWSSISTAQYGSTMTALRALIPTPEVSSLTRVDREFWTPNQKTAPLRDTAVLKRQAIVLNCEMVGIGPKATTSELARLSAVDFLTGELLVDTLVQPLSTVTDWRTQWSGITAEALCWRKGIYRLPSVC